MNDIINRAIGMALGTAVGDAKGIAYETLTRQQIINLKAERQVHSGSDQILYEKVAESNPYIPKNWLQGRWTDDTQLTLAMMRSITKAIENGNLMDHIVTEHINEWYETTDGWGNTKLAIERLANGTHTYNDSGNVAIGNGVLMKLAPLAFYYYVSGIVNDDEIEKICRMTHISAVAFATACILVHVYIYLFGNTVRTSDFLQYTFQVAVKYEAKYGLVEEKTLLSRRIKRYMDAFLSGTFNEDVLIDVSNGGTFYCVDSLSMVIGLVAISPDGRLDFETIIRATEIGGDTDSNAAMIGAIVGGTQGSNIIDKEHIVCLYRGDYVRQIGEQFGTALTKLLT